MRECVVFVYACVYVRVRACACSLAGICSANPSRVHLGRMCLCHTLYGLLQSANNFKQGCVRLRHLAEFVVQVTLKSRLCARSFVLRTRASDKPLRFYCSFKHKHSSLSEHTT